ncbi:MAG: hypothetical protein ND866_16925 [Pyrinomonadaceae bacterium]|nr:hypothetical protein [Pyrinomonadaceae bacterium]
MSDDLAASRAAGLTDRAILEATYVCAGFNIITRIADALGFKIPSEQLFSRAAKLLVIFGYKRLSGYWTTGVYNRRPDLSLISTVVRQTTFDSSSLDAPTFDPHGRKLTRLRNAVLSGPGSLSPAIRQTISEGRELSGALGAYVKKVAEHAYLITDDDIAELHRAHYTDDQIFEATVSAALGEGLLRLECVLRALRSSQPPRIAYGELSFEENSVPSPMTKGASVGLA